MYNDGEQEQQEQPQEEQNEILIKMLLQKVFKINKYTINT